MKALLVGHLSDTNLGDAAIVSGTVGLLRRHAPEASIGLVPTMPLNTLTDDDVRVCRALGLEIHAPLCPLPVREVSPERGVRLYAHTIAGVIRGAVLLATRRWPLSRAERATFAALRDADLVLLVGGSSLRADSRASHVVHVWRILFPVFAALRLRRRVVSLGASIGPIEPGLPGRLLRFGLRRNWTIYARDEGSRRALEEITGRLITFVPDLALALEPSRPSHVSNGSGSSVGISLRPLPDVELVADRLTETVAALVPRPREVVLLANAFGPSPKQDDREPLELLRSRLEDRGFPVRRLECDTPAAAQAAYGELDAVFGVRMHAAILARLGGTPSVPVEYEGLKTAGVFAYLAPGLGVADANTDFAPVLATQVSGYLADGVPDHEQAALHESRRLLDEIVGSVIRAAR